MFRALRQAFGDPSRSTLVAAAKVVLASPNAPLQESAAAIERLSHEVDSESKALVLAFAANPESHEWLQQVAGEAVAQMLETKTLNIEEITRLTPAAGEVALAILQGTEFGSDRFAVERLKAATAAGAHPAQGRESE